MKYGAMGSSVKNPGRGAYLLTGYNVNALELVGEEACCFCVGVLFVFESETGSVTPLCQLSLYILPAIAWCCACAFLWLPHQGYIL